MTASIPAASTQVQPALPYIPAENSSLCITLITVVPECTGFVLSESDEDDWSCIIYSLPAVFDLRESR